MIIQVFIPTADLRVTYLGPDGSSLVVPPEGIAVASEDEPIDQFWRRRVSDGDGTIEPQDTEA